MVLARAQLSTTETGIVAAQERQLSLLSKGKYRKAEAVAQEAAVGSLATEKMPKHKGKSGTEAQFKQAFGAWMRTALKAKVLECFACLLARVESQLSSEYVCVWYGTPGSYRAW